MKFVCLIIKPTMKTLKILILILITFTFSECYFLDYVIPEEYFAEDQQNDAYSNFVWISYPADLQFEGRYFHSLEGAGNSLKNRGITVYDSKIVLRPQNINYGYPTRTIYYVKVNKTDYRKALYLGWSTGVSKSFRY